jgi:hypothetical protein
MGFTKLTCYCLCCYCGCRLDTWLPPWQGELQQQQQQQQQKQQKQRPLCHCKTLQLLLNNRQASKSGIARCVFIKTQHHQP